VTSRIEDNNSLISAISLSRPTKVVS
jgi:hypothetical protein